MGSCRVVKQSFVLLNPEDLYERTKTVCRHLNNNFFIKLESGLEPSDAFLTSTSEPYSTIVKSCGSQGLRSVPSVITPILCGSFLEVCLRPAAPDFAA